MKFFDISIHKEFKVRSWKLMHQLGAVCSLTLNLPLQLNFNQQWNFNKRRALSASLPSQNSLWINNQMKISFFSRKHLNERYKLELQQTKTRICLIGKLFSLCFFVTYSTVWILFCFIRYLFVQLFLWESILWRLRLVFSRCISMTSEHTRRIIPNFVWYMQIPIFTSKHYKISFKRLFRPLQIYRRFATLSFLYSEEKTF